MHARSTMFNIIHLENKYVQVFTRIDLYKCFLKCHIRLHVDKTFVRSKGCKICLNYNKTNHDQTFQLTHRVSI